MLSEASSNPRLITLATICLVWIISITLPYIYAAYSGEPDYVFGGFLLNPIDGNSYLSKMHQGWQGDWQFRLPYTAYPGKGTYLFLFYLFLGHSARWFNISLILTFHLARLVGGLVLFLTLLYRVLLPQKGKNGSLWLLIIFLFGSGMGWLVLPFGLITSDYWVAEAYPFLSAYSNPHFALGLAILMWLIPLEGINKSSLPVWLIITLAMLLAIMSPFGIIMSLVVIGGMLVLEFWRGFSALARSKSLNGNSMQEAFSAKGKSLAKRMAWIALGGGWFMLYYFIVSTTNPILAVWNAQNVTPSPPLWDLFLSFSPLLILAIPGAWFAWKSDTDGGRILVTWLVLSLIWLYLPFNLQRRFMMGLYIPFAGLAYFGLIWLYQKNASRTRMLAVIVLLLSLPTNMLVLLAARHGIQSRDPMIYLSLSEAQGLEWIRDYTPSDVLVLASAETSLFIPAHTGRRVLVGHPFETVNAEAQEAAVIGFFTHQSGADFLRQWDVDYLFFGPRERLLGSLPEFDFLQLKYSNGEVEIYQVMESGE